MNLVLTLYTTFLFIIMSPGVLFTLPKIRKNVLIPHALLFAVVYYFTHNILEFSKSNEGFVEPDPLYGKPMDPEFRKNNIHKKNRKKSNQPKKSYAQKKLESDRQIAANEAKAAAAQEEEYYKMQLNGFNQNVADWENTMRLEKEGKASRPIDSRTGNLIEKPVFKRRYLNSRGPLD